MVFSTFIKQAKCGEKISFFQSAYPYLNNQSLVNFHFNNFYTKYWPNDPHYTSSNHSRYFLSIDSGHYGLYYTIFSHDAEKNKKSKNNNQHQQHELEDQPEDVLLDDASKFFISKVNKEINSSINFLKNLSNDLSFTSSGIQPTLCPKRFFSTSTRHQKDASATAEIPQSNIQEQLEEIEEIELSNPEPSFESQFLTTQVNQIINIYNNSKSSSDLNIIYPLYQSLKRNDLPCSSIDVYNIILASINERSLDNDDSSIQAIESRLTNLLTVYQDILISANSNAPLKPNNATFSIVLQGIFKGSLDCIKLTHFKKIPQVNYNEMFVQGQEFCQIGIDLLMSISKIDQLDLHIILPSLISILNVHPNLLTPDLLKKILPLVFNINNDGQYYVGLINLSQYLSQYLNYSNDEVYSFIQTVYSSYKNNAQILPDLNEYEFQIYSVVINSLMKSHNKSLAVSFLDDILIDYKNSINATAGSLEQKPSRTLLKKDVSTLISVFLESIIIPGDIESCEKSFNLMNKFNNIAYLPELTVEYYNELINNMINNYNIRSHELIKVHQNETDEFTKLNQIQKLTKLQSTQYQNIWKLYDHLAIRKDYQDYSNHENLTSIFLNNKKIQCRDFLISLSIDIGDHERVFQIIKEILLKSHLIYDIQILKKICSYLYQGSLSNKNDYYYSLMWNLIESQSSHYSHESNYLNSFISEMSHFLVGNESHANIILDSLMVAKGFAAFKLDSNNIYGLMLIMRHLMTIGDQLEIQDLNKIIQYQSLLINEFEDSENHYLEVNDDVKLFKQQLNTSFVKLIDLAKASPSFKFTNDIIEACRNFDDISINQDVSTKVIDADYNLNLSHFLQLNYNAGVDKFIDLFKKGYKFNESTWLMIINQDFLMKYLMKNHDIKIESFVSRILALNFTNDEVKSQLIANIINYNLDKLNIHILKFIINESNIDLLKNSQILADLSKCSSTSTNKYFNSLMVDNFSTLIKSNPNKEWVSYFFTGLISKRQFESLYSLYQSNSSIINSNTNLKSKPDLSISNAICTCLLELEKFDEFTVYFKSLTELSNKQNLKISDSNELVHLLLNYYIAKGDFEIALKKFAPLIDKFALVNQSYRFAEFMYSLKNANYKPIEMKRSTLPEVANFLITGKSTEKILENFKHDESYFKSKEELINLNMAHFANAAQLSHKLNLNTGPLNKTFQNYLKFLKSINHRTLTTANLISIIKVLTVMKANDWLNILIHKFINLDYGFSKLINFFFLEIEVKSPEDQIRILKQFQNAFASLNDSSNLNFIKDFITHNNLN
ncbi:hypothetical protein HYPBUDRAFT_126853 [Hyphopichia burtonii NRRL Y-1933]|uniref:Uncharacterized protein n=1 Tax=Hyphopichia burtonii NRRL Y-1933 TaxID=984485 RepID=A0A1E4RF32_9ASCO|nr:hypothetical protein HYPBUDRAFT_126853 [Hyphopichia burtonii NRRL Y-1933]ODV65853.1 hypothetical protein HYPBUDRAFT_126853 [Hyphopichia burtonii NRRL Y-1933]